MEAQKCYNRNEMEIAGMCETAPKQCVLAIDDTPTQLVALTRILSPLYDVKIAKTGEMGLKLAEEQDVDIILLDLVMGGISGFDVLASLKKSDRTRNIPVIFITGSGSIEDEEKGLALGAVDYIRKPFSDAVVNLRVGIQLRLIKQMKIIENFSLTDGLTGIGNRRSFDNTLKSTWSSLARTNGCFSMMLLDIDHFKQFNDNYGHLNGDVCLKVFAGILQETVGRGSDSVFRWGGEEFVALLPNTALQGALLLAERFREKIARTPIRLGTETASITVSIGAGSISPSNPSFEKAYNEFYTNLDKALYTAKAKGRNRVEAIPAEGK